MPEALRSKMSETLIFCIARSLLQFCYAEVDTVVCDRVYWCKLLGKLAAEIGLNNLNKTGNEQKLNTVSKKKGYFEVASRLGLYCALVV